MQVVVNSIQPPRVEGAGAPDDAVNLISLRQQQLSQIRTVLAGNTRDERLFHAFANFKGISAGERQRKPYETKANRGASDEYWFLHRYARGNGWEDQSSAGLTLPRQTEDQSLRTDQTHQS